jgi:rare lipoprotein A
MVAAGAASAQAGSGGASFDAQSIDGAPLQWATWYGPGFYGEQTACGKTLTRRTVGVAHRRLPCGTRVGIAYHGRYLEATVIDRGPFGGRARWDLTQHAAELIGLEQTDQIRVAVLKKSR